MPEPAERTKRFHIIFHDSDKLNCRYDVPNPFSNADHNEQYMHAEPQMNTASKQRPFEICRKEVMGDKVSIFQHFEFELFNFQLNHRASRHEKPHAK